MTIKSATRSAERGAGTGWCSFMGFELFEGFVRMRHHLAQFFHRWRCGLPRRLCVLYVLRVPLVPRSRSAFRAFLSSRAYCRHTWLPRYAEIILSFDIFDA